MKNENPHYLVMFMLDGSTERIDCCGIEHANIVYNALRNDVKKSLKSQSNGVIKTIRECA